MDLLHILHHGKKKKRNYFLIAFVIFLGIVAFMFYSSNRNFTGNVINGEKSEEVLFSARLGAPDKVHLEFTDSDVRFEGRNFVLKVGNQNFNADKDLKVSIVGFNGEIDLNKSKINYLNGNAESVFVNGVSISPDSGNLRVSIPKEFRCSYVGADNGVYIGKMSYVTSGKINLGEGKQIIRIDSERVNIKKYSGSFYFKDDLELKGSVLGVDVKGDLDFSFDSKK